jgi:hypothetical protein
MWASVIVLDRVNMKVSSRISFGFTDIVDLLYRLIRNEISRIVVKRDFPPLDRYFFLSTSNKIRRWFDLTGNIC